MAGSYAADTLKTHRGQLRQYRRFCDNAEMALWNLESCAQWLMYAWNVLEVKKNTLSATLSSYKRGRAYVGLREAHSTEVGAAMYLIDRWIKRCPDDVQPKRYVGKRGLEPGIEELRAHETAKDSKQLIAWFSISYRGLLRVSEARALQGRSGLFRPEAGSVPAEHDRDPAHRSGTRGRRAEGIFKTHANSVEFLFTRDRGSSACAVRAMYNWEKAQGWPATGPVFPMAEGAARRALQRMASRQTGRPAQEYGLHSLRSRCNGHGGSRREPATDQTSRTLEVVCTALVHARRRATCKHAGPEVPGQIEPASGVATNEEFARKRWGACLYAAFCCR